MLDVEREWTNNKEGNERTVEKKFIDKIDWKNVKPLVKTCKTANQKP